ncbi:hypothetical protein SEA_MASELOP_82 [Rhodococcus phage Maselop]|nr:hypothetical protein SEA_MASELOP_82 [Rhodococcus phage Maselop]
MLPYRATRDPRETGPARHSRRGSNARVVIRAGVCHAWFIAPEQRRLPDPLAPASTGTLTTRQRGHRTQRATTERSTARPSRHRAAQNGERPGPTRRERPASVTPGEGVPRDPDELADPLTARTGDPPDATRHRTGREHGARDRTRRISADRQDPASRA